MVDGGSTPDASGVIGSADDEGELRIGRMRRADTAEGAGGTV